MSSRRLLRSAAKAIAKCLPQGVRAHAVTLLCEAALEQADASSASDLLSRFEHQLVKLEDRNRQLAFPSITVPDFVRGPGVPPLMRSIMQPDRPWKNLACTRFDIPAMLTDEEIQYYRWLAPYYSGEHEAVELGPWLGQSTMQLVTALEPTLRRAGKRLHVFDDFVWRPSWMNKHLRPQDPAPPREHECFERLFQHFTASASELLAVQRGKITDYDGNETLPSIRWSGARIELLVVDCGRTVQANQGWMDLLSQFFIPSRTLIVMQDWRLHRERPRQPFNQTWYFTGVNNRLELVHEVVDGGIATFLYR